MRCLAAWHRAPRSWAVALALLAACHTTAQHVSDDRERLAQLRAEVRALIAEPTCRSVAQCRALPLGAKPCGGPWSYAIYSTVTTDSAALAEAVACYNAIEDKLNRREGRVSDCRFVSPPVLDCVDGRCVSTALSRGAKPHFGDADRELRR